MNYYTGKFLKKSNRMEEKTTHECKNCSSETEGQYCHFCGQRYHDHKESFGELAYEFVSDFLHFDSRFFKTIVPLLFSPGKLTIRYNEGKQRSQFHPIRLYLFSSFVYFFLFFYFSNVTKQFEEGPLIDNQSAFIIDSVKSEMMKDSLKLVLNDSISSANINKIPDNKSGIISSSDKKEFVTLQDSGVNYSFTVTSYIDSLLNKNVTPEEYLTLQKSLGKDKRAGYFERIFTARLLKINLEGEAGKKEFFRKLIETFLHNIPKMLFFLLPVFALLLKLLYIRRKQFYYVDHAILSLHYFSFIFLLLILSNYILDKIFGTDIFAILASVWVMLYLLIAMKRIYGQGWTKTIVKYFVLGFMFFIVVVLTITVNMAWSAFMA